MNQNVTGRAGRLEMAACRKLAAAKATALAMAMLEAVAFEELPVKQNQTKAA